MAFVNIGLAVWPVGSIYLSSTATSPANIFGGTWSALSESRYLRLAGAFGTGGSNTITVSNLPAHSHSLYGWNTADFASSSSGGHGEYITRLPGSDYARDTGVVGGGAAFYPAYRNCYAWYRTA